VGAILNALNFRTSKAGDIKGGVISKRENCAEGKENSQM
jgi:hypothetical protein